MDLRFFDRPVALYPPVAQEILHRMVMGSAADPVDSVIGAQRPYTVVGGAAVIPITGVLVNGPAGWGELSYQTINYQLLEASRDAEVRAIALDVASPGGEVSGLFDLAESLYAMRGPKPIVAILNDYAYSAAYALASAADKIIVPKTGGVGSVGVVALHIEVSALLEKAGVKPTIVQYGARKTDMSPLKPLSKEARAGMQDDVNVLGEMFVEMVARNRGLSTDRVRETEAGVYMGAAGVEVGFADTVQSPMEAILELLAIIAYLNNNGVNR